MQVFSKSEFIFQCFLIQSIKESVIKSFGQSFIWFIASTDMLHLSYIFYKFICHLNDWSANYSVSHSESFSVPLSVTSYVYQSDSHLACHYQPPTLFISHSAFHYQPTTLFISHSTCHYQPPTLIISFSACNYQAPTLFISNSACHY